MTELKVTRPRLPTPLRSRTGQGKNPPGPAIPLVARLRGSNPRFWPDNRRCCSDQVDAAVTCFQPPSASIDHQQYGVSFVWPPTDGDKGARNFGLSCVSNGTVRTGHVAIRCGSQRSPPSYAGSSGRARSVQGSSSPPIAALRVSISSTRDPGGRGLSRSMPHGADPAVRRAAGFYPAFADPIGIADDQGARRPRGARPVPLRIRSSRARRGSVLNVRRASSLRTRYCRWCCGSPGRHPGRRRTGSPRRVPGSGVR